MIFLKKFKAVGFKSFANHIDITFDTAMTGIVGPNGSGKSNIVDAIKWVLGEKSNKNLRGKTSQDIIFHGAKDVDESKFAQITLVFDNKSKIIHSDADEVIVSRKLTRGSGNNEYFLNGNECRLKDIQELFLDTGLSKGSLGIISQGTVQWFVEAKPEERRKIFEDAAGIGLYTKRKQETQSQLDKATENLNRVTDYVNILDKDLKKLSKQAEKAKTFAEKKQQLMELDLIILVKDINHYQQKVTEIKQSLTTVKEDLFQNESDMNSIIEEVNFTKSKVNISDNNLESLNKRFSDLIEQINKIEIKKSSLESQLNSDLTSDNSQKKAEAYKQIISSLQFELDDNKSKLELTNLQWNEYQNIKKELSEKRESLMNEINLDSSKLNEAKFQLKSIDDAIYNELRNEIGVKTILENLAILPGIEGTLKQFLSVEENYEKAITTALGKAGNFIVVDNQESAKYAIDFLKRNKAGRATFLPIESVQPKSIRHEHELVLNQLDGYINTAFNLITCNKKYENIFSSFLGRVLISENLNSAINASKYTSYLYQSISLEGDFVSAGGAITGGFQRQSFYNSLNLKQKQEKLIKKIEAYQRKFELNKIELLKLNSSITDNDLKLNEKNILISRCNERITEITNNLYRHKIEYDQLVGSNEFAEKDHKWTINEIDSQLANLQTKKDKLNEELNINRQIKFNNKQALDESENKLLEIRELVDKLRIDQNRNETDLFKAENIIKNAKDKIANNYHMTLDYACANYTRELPMSETQARELIYQLNIDIEKIGGVNMEAFVELENKQKEFDDLSRQQDELKKAQQKIIQVIKELDAKATIDFTTTINKVNETLPYVFKYLFGGGNCQVEYTDPENVLSSGIEVTANPPGKKILNLNLLSGGEKTLVALSILFAILKIHSFPLVILDEAESALDPANVERFGNIIKDNSDKTQFLTITHRPGTMERCNSLYGATMQLRGITNVYKVSLGYAKDKFSSDENKTGI